MPGMGGSPPFGNNYKNNINNYSSNNNISKNHSSSISMHDYARCLKDFMNYKNIPHAIIGGCSWGGK